MVHHLTWHGAASSRPCFPSDQGPRFLLDVVTLTHHWTAFGLFSTIVQAPALIGVLAALTVALGLGGLSTIRRATI